MSIDLGFERPDYGDMPAMSPDDMEMKVMYPSVYIDSDKKLGLPKKGTVTFRYELKSETSREGRDQEPKYSCELELQAIESSEKGSKSDRKESSDEALDNLRKKKDEEADDNYSDESEE